jgi:hypothetical protein
VSSKRDASPLLAPEQQTYRTLHSDSVSLLPAFLLCEANTKPRSAQDPGTLNKRCSPSRSVPLEAPPPPTPEFHYRWEWWLRSSPEQLWPFVSDTNRFNRNAGLPAFRRADEETRENARRGYDSRGLGYESSGASVPLRRSPMVQCRIRGTDVRVCRTSTPTGGWDPASVSDVDTSPQPSR